MPESIRNVETDTKFKDVLCILTLGKVDCPVSDYLSRLSSFFSTYKDKSNGSSFVNWSFILHDMDVLENGELKTPHIHIVCHWGGKQGKRRATWISLFAREMGLLPQAVNVRCYNSLAGSIQYLIHKNDPDKFQYEMSSIVTSYPDDELKIIMESEIIDVSFDRFKSVCWHAHTISDVISVLGISVYRTYRSIILDIWGDVQCARSMAK